MSIYPEVNIVGMHFRGSEVKSLVREFTTATSLQLVREPENEYDQNAIKVLFEDTHIGYVERGQATWIAPDMDLGKPATIELTSVDVVGAKTFLTATIRTGADAEPEVEDEGIMGLDS